MTHDNPHPEQLSDRPEQPPSQGGRGAARGAGRPSALAPRGPDVWRRRLIQQRREAEAPLRAGVELLDDVPDYDGMRLVRLSCGHVRTATRDRLLTQRMRCVACLSDAPLVAGDRRPHLDDDHA